MTYILQIPPLLVARFQGVLVALVHICGEPTVSLSGGEGPVYLA